MHHQDEKRITAIPKIEPVKFIERSNGTIKGYSVNTFHGLVKNYNEDRVSIIMNITKPNFKGRWPRCSYFGVFDGHGGNKCSDFLKENMHKYVKILSFRSPKILISLINLLKHLNSDSRKRNNNF